MTETPCEHPASSTSRFKAMRAASLLGSKQKWRIVAKDWAVEFSQLKSNQEVVVVVVVVSRSRLEMGSNSSSSLSLMAVVAVVAVLSQLLEPHRVEASTLLRLYHNNRSLVRATII